MKASIHPDYHKITVVMTDGSKFETRSTWGKEGDSYQLDVDPIKHPAWNKGQMHIRDTGQITKFNKRFAAFGAPAAAIAATAPDTAPVVPQKKAAPAAAPAAKEKKAKK